METVLLIVIITVVVVYLTNKIDRLKNLFESRITSTNQLEFSFTHAVLNHPTILALAGITKTQYHEDYDKWPAERKKKWESFIKSKDSNFDSSELSLTLTYLSHEDIFIAESFNDKKRFSYVVLNRTPNNTYLFDKTLVYHPSKDNDLRNEHIRLEVKMREDNGFYLITAGIREFENKIIGGKSQYTKIFDFPFARQNGSSISDGEYEKFDFKVDRQTPWYDKDDFGKHVTHPWDTQVKFTHTSGAEITYQY